MMISKNFYSIIISFVIFFACEPSKDNQRKLFITAGPDRTIHRGQKMELVAEVYESSNPQSFTYLWSVISSPSGSSSYIEDPSVSKTIFTADSDGEYLIQLLVSSGSDISQFDTLKITQFYEQSQQLLPNTIGNWWKYVRTNRSGTIIDTITANIVGVNTDGSRLWEFRSATTTFNFDVYTTDSTAFFSRQTPCDFFEIKYPLIINRTWTNHPEMCSKYLDNSIVDQQRHLNVKGGIFESYIISRQYYFPNSSISYYNLKGVVPYVGIIFDDSGSDIDTGEIWELIDYHLVN